jgi:protein-tyrosine-phosphatase
MAEGLLRQLLATRGSQGDWDVLSAGTWGQPGLPANQNTLAVLRNRGIDLSLHKSKIVSSDLIDQADLILTMEGGHKEALQIEFPIKKGKILLLSELIDEEFDIEDPMGEPIERFERVAKEIEMILNKGFDKMTALLLNSALK